MSTCYTRIKIRLRSCQSSKKQWFHFLKPLVTPSSIMVARHREKHIVILLWLYAAATTNGVFFQWKETITFQYHLLQYYAELLPAAHTWLIPLDECIEKPRTLHNIFYTASSVIIITFDVYSWCCCYYYYLSIENSSKMTLPYYARVVSTRRYMIPFETHRNTFAGITCYIGTMGLK